MGTRIVWTALAGIWLLSSSAGAQSVGGAGGGATRFSADVRWGHEPREPEPSPVTPISPAPAGGRDLFRAAPDTYAPRYHQHLPLVHPFPFGGTTYLYVPPASAVSRAPRGFGARTREHAREGTLLLLVSPRSSQVYVDGDFVGTVDDLNAAGRGLMLLPGSYGIELRADGFDTVAFDVRITGGETLTYRKELMATARPRPGAAVAPVQPGVARTIYLIPNCYAGDTPPVAADLPARCQVADLRTIPAP